MNSLNCRKLCIWKFLIKCSLIEKSFFSVCHGNYEGVEFKKKKYLLTKIYMFLKQILYFHPFVAGILVSTFAFLHENHFDSRNPLSRLLTHESDGDPGKVGHIAC